jgi:hypothetical protein
MDIRSIVRKTLLDNIGNGAIKEMRVIRVTACNSKHYIVVIKLKENNRLAVFEICDTSSADVLEPEEEDIQLNLYRKTITDNIGTLYEYFNGGFGVWG